MQAFIVPQTQLWNRIAREKLRTQPVAQLRLVAAKAAAHVNADSQMNA